ncbi:uncharacterized protein LOC62_07G009589 [Vanrija pseudolonga]|uniref:Uncharacterized protein n=1 Tax=Vanrija pseudolonga TaxID=143232 RepID=A0AAF1BQG3_9TREE|nr:hypothetical protein LOC62_07G009589 [Vanrija pseudolonga]
MSPTTADATTNSTAVEASTSSATTATADPNTINYGGIVSDPDFFPLVACHFNNKDTHTLRLVSKSFLDAVDKFVPDAGDKCWFKVMRPFNSNYPASFPAIVPDDGGRVQFLPRDKNNDEWNQRYLARTARALRNVRELKFEGSAVIPIPMIAAMFMAAKIFPHLDHVVLYPLITDRRPEVYQTLLDVLFRDLPTRPAPSLAIVGGIGALNNPTGPFVPNRHSHSPIVVPASVQRLDIIIMGFWADLFDDRVYPQILFAEGQRPKEVNIDFLGPKCGVGRQERVESVAAMKRFLGVTGRYVNHDTRRREWLIELLGTLVTSQHQHHPKRVKIIGIQDLRFPRPEYQVNLDNEVRYIIHEVAIRSATDDVTFGEINELLRGWCWYE